MPIQPEDVGQWGALGGAGLLLAMLMRLGQKFVSVVTDGALSRVETLEKRLVEVETQATVDRLEGAARYLTLETRRADDQRECEQRLHALEVLVRDLGGVPPPRGMHDQ